LCILSYIHMLCWIVFLVVQLHLHSCCIFVKWDDWVFKFLLLIVLHDSSSCILQNQWFLCNFGVLICCGILFSFHLAPVSKLEMVISCLYLLFLFFLQNFFFYWFLIFGHLHLNLHLNFSAVTFFVVCFSNY